MGMGVGGGGETVDKNIKITLENRDLWGKFHALGTEMIITKTGRYGEFEFCAESLNWAIHFRSCVLLNCLFLCFIRIWYRVVFFLIENYAKRVIYLIQNATI